MSTYLGCLCFISGTTSKQVNLVKDYKHRMYNHYQKNLSKREAKSKTKNKVSIVYGVLEIPINKLELPSKKIFKYKELAKKNLINIERKN